VDADYVLVLAGDHVIRRSILFAKVRVGDGSLVEDSVVLPNVVIGRHAVLERAVVDKRCVLPDGFMAGVSAEEDRERFHVTERGIVLITAVMLEQPVP
jgi:glucose-1-phosphate adenylyltransferase